ncbi:hypothetical protein SmaMPs15_000056 [Stenotrophomonas maltophilia phage vB_SmaM_Ps15]|uniref:Uncharacterized protein n=1 Tax=Stenotrophomonas maltophilia phage vB_SmaM_Ps15 TaxID=3071007 RepID=A0AAE9JUW5_9CAUD|nr:hypothetical protein PQC01_gp056 [Stenotrophomonas maltophilia phage vB_SmaM_Ps15]UMO77207.1 hypothetical protein SmaMPs15_000056 [Stenotrophomonas maltophilia phage vB_SmaM_Ps15]
MSQHGHESCEATEEELQFYREAIGELDMLLIGLGVFEVNHEGDYKQAWKNTLESIKRLNQQERGFYQA